MTVSAIAAIVALLLVAGFLLSALDRRTLARTARRRPPSSRRRPPSFRRRPPRDDGP